MPTLNKNERTRAGCWTCRARRKKCDETRPQCTTCHDLGLHCEGYAFRLKWAPRTKGCVVRSRSSNGKGLPKVHPSPVTVADSSANEALLYHLGKELYQSLTDVQREIMQGCTQSHTTRFPQVNYMQSLTGVLLYYLQE
jgi:hypothetical protein